MKTDSLINLRDDLEVRLRDYLAGQALVMMGWEAYACTPPEQVAENAYKIADAMLKFRSRRSN